MRKLPGDERTSLAMLALMFGLAAVNWPLLPGDILGEGFGLGIGGGCCCGPSRGPSIPRAVAERSGLPVTGYLANAH